MLREQLAFRMMHLRAQPPAWQQFLLTLYAEFPPPTLDAQQCEAEARAVVATAPMSAGVLKCLRRALLLYHPDKNRAEDTGAEWAALAEEVSKMGTELMAHYRQRVAATSSEDLFVEPEEVQAQPFD